MIILSQDKKGFVIIGRGCSIYAFEIEGPKIINGQHVKEAKISCFTGGEETEDSLGYYDNIEQAKSVLKDIYDSIGNGIGKYEMPARKTISLRFSEVDHKGTPIDNLNLSVRTYNCLKRAGINTVEGLLARDTEDFMKIRNLGQKCLSEVLKAKEKLENQEDKNDE